MVLQNKHVINSKKIKLSIQISLSGLSFCILNPKSNTITFIKEVNFEKKVNPLQLLEVLQEQFNTESILQEHQYDVCVIHDNNLSALVPKPLFHQDNMADYLKFSSKILKTDFITYDELLQNDSINVYVPYININNYIYDLFGEFTYKHISTVLISALLQKEKNTPTTQVYVHVSKTHFELIIIEQSKLLFYNSFEYETAEDFIYYILFTAEQLNLNPETLQLVLIGAITNNSSLYKIIYKYIRNVKFGTRQDTYKYNTKPTTNYSNFSLIKSF